MKPPSVNTLILITAGRCCRADVDARGEISGVWSQARRGGLNLAESVRLALGLGSPVSGRGVLVLTTEVWTQTLSLHRGQVSGLARAELEQALAFEAEPFSGLSALESVLGFCDSGARDGTASFWIVQLARGEREAVLRVVKEGGARLQGIAHPGAVPAPLGAVASGTAWRRIECWDGAWLLVLCEDGRSVQVKVVPSAPEPRDLPAHGTLERLNARENSPFTAEEVAWSLNDEVTLRSWFEKLARMPGEIPLIQAEAAAPPRHLPKQVGILLTAAVIVTSIAQALWLGREKQSLTNLQQEYARLQPLIETTNRESAKLKTELGEVQQKLKNLQRLIQQRGSVPELLRALAEHCPETIVFSQIKPERGVMNLSGIALEAMAVDEMSIVLSGALKPVGLVATPLEKKARQAQSNRGPWDFTIAVMPVEQATRNAPPVPTESDN